MNSHSKVALVTGAGTGIGKAVARALVRDGFAVALVGRRREPLEQVAEEAGAVGAITLVMPADVGDQAAVRKVFAQVKAHFGRLDLLFNNAGTGAPAMPFEDVPLEKWQEVVDVNLTGAFICTQEAFKIMKAQTPRGGRIINNGSIAAHSPRPLSAAYTATKHAITGLTKSTALDGRAYDIACGQIDIGNALTPLTERIVGGSLQPDGRKVPEPRMDAEHVGCAVSYMAGLPLDANVLFMTVMATRMPFVGRG